MEFWAVVAQTVPVIALALVVEVRAFGRQVRGTRTFAATKPQRRYFVISTTVAAALLIVTFVLSLGALQEVIEYHVAFTYVAMYSLAFCLGAVVINPLVALLPALTSDIRADRKLERERKRNLRARTTLTTAIEWAEAIRRRRNLDQLTEFADNYTRVLAFIRRTERDPDPGDREKLKVALDYLAELDAWKSNFDREQVEGRDLIAEGREMLIDLRSEGASVDIAPYVKELRRLVD